MQLVDLVTKLVILIVNIVMFLVLKFLIYTLDWDLHYTKFVNLQLIQTLLNFNWLWSLKLQITKRLCWLCSSVLLGTLDHFSLCWFTKNELLSFRSIGTPSTSSQASKLWIGEFRIYFGVWSRIFLCFDL